MRPNRRTAIFISLAAISALATRAALPATTFDVIGRNPAALIAADGSRHVIYVDAATRALIHQRVGSSGGNAVSPHADAVDVRGENAPVFTALADGTFVVIYPV